MATRKSEFIMVRVTPAEKLKAEKVARYNDQPMSALCREMLLARYARLPKDAQ